MIEKIIHLSMRNKTIVGVLTFVLIIWGVWSATRLPIDALPDITNNQVQIYTVTPTLAGQEVEQFVTFPIEQSLSNLPDLVEIRSISRFGLSVVTAVFEEDVDIYFCRQLINERLKEAEDNIPPGIGTPQLVAVSTGLGEIYQYIIHPKKGSEENYSAADLREIQDWIVARQLIRTEGVAEVNSFGGKLREYEVAIDPYRLKSMNVSVTEVFDALEHNNENTGGAYIEKNPNAYFIRGIGLVTSLEDVENIAVKNADDATPIFIRNIADVRYGEALRYGAMTLNGESEVVGGVVMMLKGANSNEVVKRVKSRVEEIQKTLPDDIVIEPFLERSDLVGRAINTVQKNLIEGALIVIFVLVLFLGNLRAGLIVASAIPLSMLFALGMMNVFGVSANLMSLGAIDFGLIVDGAVIITEAILHLLGGKKITRKWSQTEMDEMVEESAGRMMHSAVFGQIVILIVYIPILSLVGVEGKMFKPMAQTVSFAIIGATILSLTYIPVMCSLFLSKKPITKKSFSDKMVERIVRIYQPLLQKAIRVKKGLILITVGIFVFTVFVFKNMGGEFIPQLQEGDFAYHCILPQGSSLSQSIEISMQVSRIIKEFDEVKDVVAKTGSAEIPTDPMPPETSDLVITLKPKKEWKRKISYQELTNEIMERLDDIPGVFFESNQPIQMRFNELMTGIRQDVAVKIFGDDLDSLAIYAKKVNAIMHDMQGVSEPQIEQTEGLPQIEVQYDRKRLANYGLTVENVNDVLSTAFAGKAAGRVYENERNFNLVVRLDSAFRKDIDNVENLMITTSTGNFIPLAQVATVDFKTGPAQISREDGCRRIVIGFNVVNRDVQSVVKELEEKLNKEIDLPTGYYFTFGGQFQNLEEASARLLIAVPVALLLIFMILYFTFRSLKEALLIFTAIPMSAIGGVFLLLMRGMPFSISAGIGFIALFGVAVLNGIVLISTFNQLEKEGWEDIVARVIEGTKIRLRPVLMTAAVASLGFLPMALSTSAGAEVQKPLATVVIGGLISATFLTLFVLPLLYIFFHPEVKMKKPEINKIGIIVFLIVSFGSTSLAQDTSKEIPKVINVEEAIAIAMENNGGIRANQYELQATQQLVKSVGQLPKLEVSSQFGQNNTHEMDNAFSVSQTIPFPTLFGAQKKLYKVGIESQQIQNSLQVLTLKNQIRTYYYQLQYLLQNRKQITYLKDLYQRFIAASKVRFQSGEGSRVEISTANAKAGEIEVLLKQNDSYFEQTYRQLQAAMNYFQSFTVQEDEPFDPLKISALLDTSQLEKHPYFQSKIQEIRLAEQQIRYEKSEVLPDFTIGYTNQSFVGFQNVNGQEEFFDSRKRFHSFHVGISIPLAFGANINRMKSIGLKKKGLEEKLQQEKREYIAQMNNAILQYRQDLMEFDYYQNQALKNAEEIENTTQTAYQAGEITYIEFFYALQTASDIRMNYLKSIQQVNQSAIEIYYLINQ